MSDTPVLEVEDLVKHYPAKGGARGGEGVVHAVDGVSFSFVRIDPDTHTVRPAS